MPAPLEFRDSTPLPSVVLDIRELVEREKVFREALAWKIRLIEREIQYLEEQVTALTDSLRVPEEILSLEQESDSLNTTLRHQRERLSELIRIVSDEEWRIEGEELLHELDQELTSSTHQKGREAIQRILRAYVTLGEKYRQKFEHRIHTLGSRRKLLEGELRRSIHEENRQRKLLHLCSEYLSDHPESTYEEFRGHILTLLGKEISLEIQQVLGSLLDETEKRNHERR